MKQLFFNCNQSRIWKASLGRSWNWSLNTSIFSWNKEHTESSLFFLGELATTRKCETYCHFIKKLLCFVQNKQNVNIFSSWTNQFVWLLELNRSCLSPFQTLSIDGSKTKTNLFPSCFILTKVFKWFLCFPLEAIISSSFCFNRAHS